MSFKNIVIVILIIILQVSIISIMVFSEENVLIGNIDNTFKTRVLESIEVISDELTEVINIPFRRDISDKELAILVRIVEAEATGGGLNEKENVAQCILNRVDGDVFKGNTIKKIVFQKNQFSPISDKRYYSVKITESSRQAVENVLLLVEPKHNALFFKAKWCESNWFNKHLDKIDVGDNIHDYYNTKED